MKRVGLIALSFALLLSTAALAAGCGEGGQSVSDKPIYIVEVIGGTGTGHYYEGDICKVTATVPEGKNFLKWTANDEDVSAEEEYIFEVTGDVEVVAVFNNAIDYADKEVFTVKTVNGIGDGAYLEGSQCTVTLPHDEQDRDFRGWTEHIDAAAAEGDEEGTEGAILSEAASYTFTVTRDITLEALYNDVRLETPANDADQMFKKMGSSYSDMIVEIDRQKNDDGSNKTAFAEGTDYVMFYLYTSTGAKTENYVGRFKLELTGATSAHLVTLDGTASIDCLGSPGNYYFDRVSNEEFFAFIKAAVGESYDPSQEYYVAAQAVALKDPVVSGETSVQYVSSKISAIGTSVILENA